MVLLSNHKDRAMKERLLRLRDVTNKTGMGSSTIYRKMNDGEFPRPVRISPAMVRWRESDIDSWISRLSTSTDAKDE